MANIGSYMGGVDLWQNEDETYDNFDPQSMHDKILEIVSISGMWHLGTLQVILWKSFEYLKHVGLVSNSSGNLRYRVCLVT